MSDPRDSNHRDRYDRPNTGWVCGRLAEGCPCAAGPDSRGRCTTPTTCVPKKENDRWKCARSPLIGGACENGPMPDGTCCQQTGPCSPIRDLRSKRKRFALCSMVLVVGLLMIGVSGPSRDDFLSPGELTSPHARLVGDQGCIACHDAAEHRVGGWIGSWLGLHSIDGNRGSSSFHVGGVQNEKCMVCHTDQLDTHWAGSPHGVDPDWLALKTDGRGTRDASFTEMVKGVGHLREHVACATCHREHHGNDSDLSALTDRQCQTCHAESFTSLGVGHPDFGDWPYRRRTRIAFDHASHGNQHFPDRQTSFDCNRCHSQSDDMVSMELAGFEQSCASCHQQSIRESAADGIALLTLPAVDIELLARRGYDVGSWPAQASGYFDGSIPPLMQLLLAADEDAAAAMSKLGPHVDFSTIDEDDPEQMAAVTVITDAIKRLVDELSVDGSDAIVRRMSLSLGRAIDEGELPVTRTRTPSSMFAAIQSSWFPKHGDGDVLLPTQPVGAVSQTTQRKVARSPITLSSHDEPSVWKGERSREELVAYVNQRGHSNTMVRTIPGQDTDSEWLAENPLSGFAVSENTQDDRVTEPVDSATDIEIEIGPRALNTERESPGMEPEISNDESISSDSEVDTRTIESYRFLSSGVWEYDEQRWVLEYHIDGHRDAFLTEWIELLQTTRFQTPQTHGERVANYFASDVAPGRCNDCHSIDRLATNDLATQLVHWRAKQADSSVRGFTRFSHRPHLIQSELSDCSACHSIDAEVEYRANYETTNPHDFRSGFKALSKDTCVNCHQPQRASDRCTTCHNYHVQSQAAGSTR